MLINNLLCLQLTLHAKRAAEDASKHALDVSKQAAGVSKNTFEDLTYVGKSTLGDLTKSAKEAVAAKKQGLIRHAGDGSTESTGSGSAHSVIQRQSTGGSVASGSGGGGGSINPGTQLATTGGGNGNGGAPGSGLMAGTGQLFSSFNSEMASITSSTSSMFSGLFGKSELNCRCSLNAFMQSFI